VHKDSPEHQDLKGDDDDTLRFLQALPSALAGLLPRVRILHISNARLRFIRTDFFLALSRFESVKSLTLDDCELNNMTQLRRIVFAFPQLTDLTMHVNFAQRGAASHAGASLFRPPSHIHLRYLDIVVKDEHMVMFLDWMSRSDLCTSLADLTIWSEIPSTTRLPLNQLLETAGASLTRFNEIYYGNKALTHGDLSQNTALQSLDFGLCDIGHTAESQRPRAAWTTATDELHGIFSTIRSHQLEHIEFQVDDVFMGGSIAESEQPSAVLEELDLRDLHEVMSQPYFDTLKDVEVKMYVQPRFKKTTSNRDSIAQKIQPMFHGILQPWSARGLVRVTVTRV